MAKAKQPVKQPVKQVVISLEPGDRAVLREAMLDVQLAQNKLNAIGQVLAQKYELQEGDNVNEVTGAITRVGK